MKNIIIISFFFVSHYGFTQEETKQISLQEAIEFAFKNSYSNKQAGKDLEYAKNKKWETTATGLPQIDGKLDYRSWLKQQVQLFPSQLVGLPPGGFVPVKLGTKQSVNGSVTLTQLIFSGSYLVGLQSAKTYMKISEQAKKKTELSTREAVINAYGNLLVTDESIKILVKNTENIKKTLGETKEIYKNGLTEQESVEQLEITLGMLENNLRNAKRMRIVANQMLNISMGNKNNENYELTDSLEKLSNEIDLNLLSKEFTIDKNIDFQIALNNRTANELLLKLEKTKYLPTLAGYVNYGVSANADKFDFLKKEQDWFGSSLFGISLNVPIFSSLGRNAKVQQAKINLEKVDIQIEEIKQKLSLQATAAKSEYQLSIENLETSKKNLKLSERIERKNKIKFKEGISSSFDLFQAQNQLYSQQNNYIQSMLDVIAKKTKLETILNTTK